MGEYTLSWKGRQLVSVYDNEYITTTYGYNADGIRTYKQIYDDDTGDTTRYEYILNGSQIVKETAYLNNVEQYMLVYIYDETGAPIGMKYRTPSMAKNIYTCFFFEKNLQGDILGVYREDGAKVIAYTYDAWGNFTTTYPFGSSAASIARYNPFKYRGYYYDSDLELYYLQTRYYNPQWCRFINADGYVSTGQGLLGYNMFAYCGNNPVNRVDPAGRFWSELWEAFTQTLQHAKGYFAVAAGISQLDSPAPGYADIAAGVLLVGGVLVCAGIATYATITAPSRSVSIPKVEEKEKDIAIPKESDSLVLFPTDPNNFNPVGLLKVPRAGTKNGAIISWMDPLTNTEVFRWDENPNYSDGPHYHINGTGHYYPGDIVPEPYATTYFPFK